MPYLDNDMKSIIKYRMDNIEKAMYTITGVLDITAYRTKEPVPFNERTSGEKLTLKMGDTWGELWDCAWFNFKGTAPESDGREAALVIDISGELCIFDENGCPVRALTNVTSEFDYRLGKPGKRIYHLPAGTKKIDVWGDAGCNDLFGNYKDSGTVKNAYTALVNEDVRTLYYDLEVLYELMEQLDPDSARSKSILFTMFDAVKDLDEINNETALKAHEILKKELDKKGGTPSLKIYASGHAHLDLAWLWPIRETVRKAARTFSTAVAMMDRYPDYIFGATQPQAYEWVKKYYPDLYAKVKQKIAEGRWEPQGAMWVEPDTNISGGEALIRQIIYGKQFFKEEFDKDMNIVFLPDVFGYTGALPQIMRKSGIEYFLTIKLSWNTYNVFPHHSFIWKGIDGSDVIVHMPPEGVYNSSGAPRAAKFIEKNFIDKGCLDECLMMFGIGDGGGGPGMEHLERLKREKNLEGICPVEQEFTGAFFDRLKENKDKLKEWNGELYLEKHQGTYTTQAKNKLYNRRSENALRELEFADVLSGKRNADKNRLDEIWKEILLYQFHDILPGSSIDRVYNESRERYGILLDEIGKMTNGIYDSIFSSENGGFTAVNTTSFERSEWIKHNGKWHFVTVPSMGYAVISNNEDKPEKVTASENMLENDKLRVMFNADGTIASVTDLENGREYVNGDSNVLELYEDNGDAWDFNILSHDMAHKRCELCESKYYTDGPSAVRENVYRTEKSEIVQKIVLTLGSRRIDFVTKADWNETHKMFRTSFAANVFTDHVTCDIQFGNIKRTNNNNTMKDTAQYEICAHKWIDLSQTDYGVSLLNNCKYGHSVNDNVMDINLLRSPTAPGETADKGTHEFTYSLYPHEGGISEGGTAKEGYMLNMPLVCIDKAADRESFSFVSTDKSNIVVETVKYAEDNDDIIIRAYENSGASTSAEFTLGINAESVCLTDMTEKNPLQLEFDKNTFRLDFKPYEINTVRVRTK